MTYPAQQADYDMPRPLSRRFIISAAMWTVAGACALTLVTKGVRTHGYLFDMSANFASHFAWFAAVLACVALVTRRFWCALVLVLVAGAHTAWLADGRARPSTDPSAPTISILQFNALSVNRTPDRVVKLLEETEADLVGIVEVPDATIELIHHSATLKAKYPYQYVPTMPDEQNKVRLSKYPFQILDLVDESNPRDKWSYVLSHTALVDHPAGKFVHALMIPISPRTPSDWTEGTAELATDLHDLSERIGSMDLPWIIGIDMNSTPGTERTDVARRLAHLRRAKPQMVLDGTWPSWLPGPFRVAIDDLLVSDHVRVKYWRVLGHSYGSDHAPVEAVVTLEGTRR